jgi:NADP-dependent 3-hydroxy acid dehydrogenase YdfG
MVINQIMKSVLITGGSSGIGEFLAKRLAKSGDKVYITGRSEERLNKIQNEIDQLGGTCFIRVADVKDYDLAQEIIEDAIEKMGGLDVFVANSGVGKFGNIETMTEEDYDSQFDTNVKGVFNYLGSIVEYMKKQGSGQIIVTSSDLGLKTSSRASIYAATKHAIQAMIGSLRKELTGSGVKAATICPGSVDTPWYKDSSMSKSKMIDVEEVVDAFMLIINQGPRSNIDHIHLIPAIG